MSEFAQMMAVELSALRAENQRLAAQISGISGQLARVRDKAQRCGFAGIAEELTAIRASLGKEGTNG